MTPGGGLRRCPVSAALLLAASLLAVLAATADGATRYDPRLRFRSLTTPHFTIHYHQGAEQAARRLAVVAEEARSSLEARLKLKAPRHTHLVLVDQTDAANGWATPVPYNLIEIALVPPAPASSLGNHDDWLRVVFTHEYAHVMHLDQVGGYMRAFRWVLGRQEASFPNLAVPGWQVEGMATWAEGAGTRAGRVHAADVRAITRARSAAGAPGLDLLGGGLVAWPWGFGPYFYGGQFYEYLARRGGDESLGDLARQTARRLPYFGAGAFEKVYGANASTLWREFLKEGAEAEADAGPHTSPGRRLTTGGYLASAPRFSPALGPSAAAAQPILYSRATPHGFAAIWETDTAGRAPRKIVDRYDGESLAFDGEWVVYDRLEFDGPVARFSDLWAAHRRTGRTIRLTHGARMSDADVSSDGARLAAVVSEAGDRALVLHRLEHDATGTPRVVTPPERRIAAQGCVFATPRWSPDGRSIAAVRHCTGSLPGIVLIHTEDGTVAAVASDPDARDVTPAWTPDGRWIVFASDRGGPAFGLFAVPVAAGSLETANASLILRPPGGAMWPAVDAAGANLVYLAATAEGLDVFSAPLPALLDEGGNPPAVAARLAADTDPPAGRGGSSTVAPPRDRPYSPWASLLPRAWMPLVELDGDRVDAGAGVGGSDVLGRHFYWAQATAALSRDEASPGFPGPSGPDWLLSYTYDRWRPTMFAAASSGSDVLRVRFAGTNELFTAWHRTLEVSGGVLVPVRRTRWSQTLLLSADLQRRVISLPSRDVIRQRNAVRGGWAFNSARQFGYSISPESGARIGLTAEHVSPSMGADGTSTTVAADVRGYLAGGFPHAVLAVRAAVGASTGDASVRRVFTNGGTRAGGALLAFGDGVVGLVRGFDHHALAGSAAGTLNVDYRFPLLRVERGAGLWPLFVHSLHGAVFADVGGVGASLGTLAAPVWSVGAECAALVTVGYGLRVSLAGGVAWTHQAGRSPRPEQAAFFVRTGYAF